MPFIAITEDWRLRGRMTISGRLTDALNKREAIAISDVTWGPPDGSAPLEPAPGLKSVDPYDLIMVTAGEDSLPPLTETERTALKVHKVAYDVALELPPFRVIGTIYLHPGSEPDRLLDRSSEMFVPTSTRCDAELGDVEVSDPEVEVILVNRFYLRGVEQVDKRTGLAAPEAARCPDGRHELAGPLALTGGAGPGPGRRLRRRRDARLREPGLARVGGLARRPAAHVPRRAGRRDRARRGPPGPVPAPAAGRWTSARSAGDGSRRALPGAVHPVRPVSRCRPRAAGPARGRVTGSAWRATSRRPPSGCSTTLGVALDLVASSESLGVEKPDPAFFAAIATRLDLPPGGVAYVGDRLDNDVRPAAAAGMRAIFLRRVRGHGSRPAATRCRRRTPRSTT